jgi:hypothetical protein
MQEEEFGEGSNEPPLGYEGHTSIGLNCLRCGVSIKGDKWRKIHDEWHERHGE